MTLGEKIKKARTENGMTQNELAEKLMVSRQAITKWEADKGVPDVQNLKTLAQLFDISLDYLLDDEKLTDMNVIREQIDLSQYKKTLIPKARTDVIMRDRFPDAEIRTLVAKKQPDKADKVVDEALSWFTAFTSAAPISGVPQFLNSLKLLGTEYYIVNMDDRQYFVSLDYKEGVLESHRIAEPRDLKTGDKFTIGDLVFADCGLIK